MKSITQRLAAIEAVLRRNEPEKLFVRLADGSTETADAATIWDFFKDEGKRKQVVDVWTESPGFEELAGLVEALCRS